MNTDEQGAERQIPSDAELRLIIAQTLEQIFIRAQVDTDFLLNLQTKLAGVEAHTRAAVEVVDANEQEAAIQRQIGAQKEVISHLFDKSLNYVTVIVAGAFAAYFATLSAVLPRLDDVQLRWSALLMTISLSTFILWEVFNMAYIGFHLMKGDYGQMDHTPRWTIIAWVIILTVTIATALPAIGLSLYAYLKGLGAFALLSTG